MANAKPNIVFMLGDNVGFGDLGCNGGSVPTPRLDALAAAGVRFTNFNTETQCTPTRGALLTGRMPVRTGTFRVPFPGESGDYGLAPWEYTLAELFSDAGYATACYGKWHLGNVEGRFPTDQGFDEWWGISESSDEASYTAHPLYPGNGHVPKVLESKRGGAPVESANFDLETRPFMDQGIAERSANFIKRNASEGTPFFVYAPFTNVHPPMIAHPDFADVSSDPLPANIAELDYRAGQILDAIDEAGVAENTIVVWASDNAAAQLAGRVAGSSGPWRGYFGGGWEGSIRTPAMIRWPDHIPAGITTDDIIATYDWLPTLAALAGEASRVPDDRPIDGIDISSFLLGNADSSDRDSFVMLGTDAQVVSVKWKTMKVHFRYTESDSWTAPMVKPQVPSVYDLLADPAESVNLMEADLTVAWVIGEAMRSLIELEESTAEYPHIPVGADFAGYDTD
jgi:arylsulfatase A-like enzyme